MRLLRIGGNFSGTYSLGVTQGCLRLLGICTGIILLELKRDCSRLGLEG